MDSIAEEYFDGLKAFETAALFVTERIDLLDSEIYHNGIAVAIPANISTTDFIEFLKRVKDNREAQLGDSGLSVDMIYYLWHDEIAGQLRFNFINANHDELPFGCEINIVVTEQEIIEGYLQSLSSAAEKEQELFILKVYQQLIAAPFQKGVVWGMQ